MLPADPGELYQHHTERGLFVVSQRPTKLDEYNEAIKYSRVLINNKHLKCVYNPKIMLKLQSMLMNPGQPSS